MTLFYKLLSSCHTSARLLSLATKQTSLHNFAPVCFLLKRTVHSQRMRKEDDEIDKLLDRYSNFKPCPLSMSQHVEFGVKPSEQQSFCFLRAEIPVRLSNMIKEMDHLPPLLLENRHLHMVRNWYMLSFKEVMRFQKSNEKDPVVLRRFRELLSNVLNRHADVVPVIARGVMELRDAHGIDASAEKQIHYFLDRFYMSKISIRMLQHQHLLLFTPKSPNEKKTKNRIGCIDANCDVTVALHDAYEDARVLCERNYECSPSMVLEVYKMGRKMAPDTPLEFIYVPSHIHHMLFELLKNAMRAQVEQGENAYSTEPILDPIRVVISQGKSDITVKISDRGGGIPRRDIDMVFNYAFTTATAPVIPGQEHDYEHEPTVPMAGYGYGLPLARLYARYFNGDISLSSADGYGTDAYVVLRNEPSEASELLPAYTRAEAARVYDSKLIPDISNWWDVSRAHAAHQAGIIVDHLHHRH